MKLYIVKVSPACRAVWLYCLRNKLQVEIIEVDLFAGNYSLIIIRPCPQNVAMHLAIHNVRLE